MQISASSINVNDYIVDFGFVTEVKRFYRKEAIRNKTLDNTKRGLTIVDYARLVEEQQDNSYKEILDKIVVYFGGRKKTYDANDNVDVFRLKKAI